MKNNAFRVIRLITPCLFLLFIINMQAMEKRDISRKRKRHVDNQIVLQNKNCIVNNNKKIENLSKKIEQLEKDAQNNGENIKKIQAILGEDFIQYIIENKESVKNLESTVQEELKINQAKIENNSEEVLSIQGRISMLSIQAKSIENQYRSQFNEIKSIEGYHKSQSDQIESINKNNITLAKEILSNKKEIVNNKNKMDKTVKDLTQNIEASKRETEEEKKGWFF